MQYLTFIKKINIMNKLFTILSLSIFLSTCIFAQPWMKAPYFNENKQNSNFYDIQNAFNKWSEGKDLSKVKGWKSYKRWEWFYEPRVYPTGNMPDQSMIWKASQRNMQNKSVNGNSNWVSISPASLPPSPDSLSIHGLGRINCIEFHPTDANTFWVGTSQGGVWKTTDGGVSWISITDNLSILRISSIAVDPNNTNTVYIATGDIDYIGFNTISAGRPYQYGSGILKSTDGGQNWNQTGLSFNLTDGNSSLIRKIIINPSNSDKLVAAGGDGIYRSDDAGANWTKVNSNMVIDMDANPKNINTIYASTFFSAAAGSKALIMKSMDFGNTWDTLNTGIPEENVVQRIEIALTKADTNYIYAISCKMNEGMYAIHKSTNGGSTWTVAATSPNVLGWADGEYLHSIFPSIPLGDSLGQGTYDLTLVVDPNNKNKVYSGGVNMWGSSNGGTSWNFVSMWVGYFGPSIHADQHFSVFHPLTGELFQMNDGGIYKTSSVLIGSLLTVVINGCVNTSTFEIIPGCYDLPTDWTYLSSGIHNTEYYRLGNCRTDAGVIAAGAQDNGTYLYNNGEWLNTWGGDGMEAMIDHYDPNTIYATNYSGALNKSTDGGINYTSNLETPITDAGETGDWVTPYVMHPNYSNIIYTAFNNIWRSDDGGTTWNKISNFSVSGSSFKSLAVPTSNPNYIYAAKSGSIYKTANGGTSWTNITPGLPTSQVVLQYITIDGENSDNVWVCFSGYQDGKKVYHSTDGGANWANISENLPNVATNCIIFQDGTLNGVSNALYVATDIGVFYTNDSLMSTATKWIEYNIGLPNVIVNELEIHYESQKLRAATYGRGLWESDLFSPSEWLLTSTKKVNKYSDNFEIFPNPAKNILNIYANSEGESFANINVFDILGCKILSLNEIKTSGRLSKQIDISSLANGTYIIQITINNTHYTGRFVKE